MGKIRSVIQNPYKIFSFLAARGWFDRMSDQTYLKHMYRARLGRNLDLDNPQTFNEKLQWLKLYDRRPEYTKMVDKYEVRKYIANTIGEEYLIPLIGGPWNSVEEIDFDILPDQFVLKCTHDSGGLVICRAKNKLNLEVAKRKLNKSYKCNYYWSGREWPYKSVRPQIIAEQYMENKIGGGLIDYKFYCFNGEPKFLYVSEGLENHKTAKISFITMDWKFAPFRREDYASFNKLPQKPNCFADMINIVRSLASGYCFIRVDLYEINGKVYFSELTFTPCSGLMPFEPKEYDRILGDMIVLPKE